jgi:amino acid transporter
VDLSNVAVILQYAGTCAAVTRLRYVARDRPRTYRVPGGAWLVPLLGIGVCALLAWQAGIMEYVFSAVAIAVGGAIAFTTRAMQRGSSS